MKHKNEAGLGNTKGRKKQYTPSLKLDGYAARHAPRGHGNE